MRFRVAMVVAAAMLLASCWWVGPPFYKPNPADPGPLKPDRYRAVVIGDENPSKRFQVRWLPDGTIRLTAVKREKGDGPLDLAMVRFRVSGRDLWITQTGNGGTDNSQTYGLAEMRGGTLWADLAIDCDSTADIVRAAGGEVSGGGIATNVVDAVESNDADPMTDDSAPQPTGQTCAFPNVAVLERALTAYVAAHPTLPMTIRFERIED